jgi:hypothetical protein
MKAGIVTDFFEESIWNQSGMCRHKAFFHAAGQSMPMMLIRNETELSSHGRPV